MVLNMNHIEIIIFGASIFSLHYMLFIYKKGYKAVLLEFKNESEQERKRGNYIARLYVFGSLGLFIVLNIIKLLIWAE